MNQHISDEPRTVKFRTAFENKTALTFAMKRLGWEPASEDGPWNFWWASVGIVRQLSDQTRLGDFQIINHFSNHIELTRKDLMFKNIKRYFRENASQLNNRGDLKIWDCLPITYSVPNDFALFSEEFKRHPPGTIWIVKPTNRSQGKGIFLVNKLLHMNKWLREKNAEEDNNPFIVSKYVDKPLLIGGRKFDLRLYCLVLSYRPLVAYLHAQGFARFCVLKYSMTAIDDEDLGAHLTNVAFQKTEEDYNAVHGGKWTFANLWLYLQGSHGHTATENLYNDISFVLVQSLKAVVAAILNEKHSFELYGYDVLIDTALRPHLIEVNASPSLTVSTENDKFLKEEVLYDTLNLVAPPNFPEPTSMPYWEWRCRTDLHEAKKGGFTLISEPVVVGN